MILFYLILSWFVITEGKYEPNWNSLDSRPLPQWYDKAKVGILVHWGVFSVPSFGSELFWYRWLSEKKLPYIQFMKMNYQLSFTYQEFAKDFKAELFNADEWAELFAKSGAKYVVLTSKHLEGYTMWPSEYSFSWNSKDIGPKRDIVGELGEAVKKQNLVYGLYHSLYEWYHPMCLSDVSTNFTTQKFVLNKVLPEMYELIEKYKPSILWSDGDWDIPDTYWKSTEFLAWLYNESPVKDVVVTNDRWGKDTICNHGGFFTCEDIYDSEVLPNRKWENAMTIDRRSRGYRRGARLISYYSISELVEELVKTVSFGGNILINIGPTKEGIIDPIFEERLLELGEWLGINGEAIYETTPWQSQSDMSSMDVWYTSKGSVVYAIIFDAYDNVVLADCVNLFENTEITVILLGNEQNGPLQWNLTTAVMDTGVDQAVVNITLPNKSTIISQWALVLKIC